MNFLRRFWNWLRKPSDKPQDANDEYYEYAGVPRWIEPKPEHVHKGIVTAASVQDVREQLDKEIDNLRR